MDTKELERQIRDVYTTLMYGLSKLKKRIKRLEDGETGGGAQYDIIWSNPAPTDEMRPTDIVIPSLGDYDLILIIFKTYKASDNLLSVITPNGGAPDLLNAKITGTGAEIRTRDCQILLETNTIHFGNCKTGVTTSTNNNVYNVPYLIYGIKQ